MESLVAPEHEHVSNRGGKSKKATVLVVEDHEAIQQLLQVVLESRGYEFTGAQNVDDALTRVRAGGVKCIVTDWTVPVGGGERLLLELISDDATSSIPVIVTSGATLPVLTSFPNVAAVVPKPFNLDALCHTLDEHC